MAVNTRDKRAAMMSVGRPWTPRLPLPDGSFDAPFDRAMLAYRYRALGDAPDPGGDPPVTGPSALHPIFRPRRR